ncbi:glycosyltransferase family 2 protein [Weissella confusa]|uniref:glycosyltransferase family 2 protein n=1 Tax=Weissella confusa TaxID=1583 RepID=UPI0016803E18|nr:glycosyltransferase family 2 protein [Weissella confusa]MBD1490989.1 glycosyltransferase family 2 protein [Weissella confusa]MBJ7662935.1 glycosyltransferase family 2 protein [Weissella confusa]MCT0025108.1 glycosyltransferase family 2 protein [Weissella confusa]
MPKLSIIINAYNVEQYIQQAVDSVLGQSFDDFEVILIDDKSTDKTREIITNIRDSRVVKFLQTRNMGLGAGRNFGIDHAKGEYVMFLDGDDILEEDILSQVASNLRDDTDLYIYNYVRFYPDGTNEKSQLGGEPNQMYVGATNKVYASGVINGVRFAENTYFEDTSFALLAYLNARKVAFFEESLFMYRQGRVGQITKGADSARHLGVLNGLNDVMNLALSGTIKNKKIIQVINFEHFNHAFMAFIANDEAAEENATKIVNSQRRLNGPIVEYSDSILITIKDSLFMWLLSHKFFRVARLLGKVILNVRHS